MYSFSETYGNMPPTRKCGSQGGRIISADDLIFRMKEGGMCCLRKVAVFIGLVLCIMVLVSGVAIAQGGGKSLQELKAQAQKIKLRQTTEAEVIALMGPPAKSTEDIKMVRGGREMRERKLLSYGPNDDIIVIILKSNGKVYNVKYSDQP
jgi:hypothetical protein